MVVRGLRKHMESGMQAVVNEKNGITVIALTGRMDATTSGVFGDACKAELDKGAKRIILDLAGIEYISSAGLRMILTMLKSAKSASAKLAFCGMQSMVRDVFKISGFTSMLSIFDTLDEAMTSI